MTEQIVEKPKKSIFQKWWFWVIVAVVVIGAIGNAANKDQPTTAAPSPQETKKADTKVAEVAAPAPKQETKAPEPAKPKKAKMTKAMFDQLKTGMVLEEAQKIVPGEWEVISESGTKGGKDLDIHTVMYQFDGSGDLGSNANLMFQNEKLINKAQMGLK